MAIAPAGYSKRSLPDKLGYKDGQRVLFIALPAELDELASAADFKSVTRKSRWDTKLAPTAFDMIHAFTTRESRARRLSDCAAEGD